MSSKTADDVVQGIRSSDQFDRFVEEIAEHFYDGDYKDDRIPEIKASFRQQAQKAGLPEGDARAVAGRLIGSLMQEAGEKAPPPQDDDESDRPPYHPEELTDASDRVSTTWSLLDVVRAPTESLEGDADDAVAILKDGVQRALIALVSVYAADAVRNKVPPGFTAEFEKALTSPSPGGLMNFLKWAAARSFSDAAGPLTAYIDDVEKSGDGWFSRLATLRNRWAHPDEYDVETTLDETREVLEAPPSFVTTSTLAALDDGTVHWTGTIGEPISLEPFLFHEEPNLYVPEEMDPPDRLQFSAQMNPLGRGFSEIWHGLRVADQELEDPTPQELRAKLKGTPSPTSPDHSVGDPGQLSSFAEADAPGLLVVPSLAAAGRSALRMQWPSAQVLSYALEDDQSLRDPLSDLLGLNRSPSWEDLCRLQHADTPAVFVVDVTDLESSAVLQRLYELADLHDTCAPAHLKFILCRPQEAIENDQEAVWDRLPSHLSDLLFPPSSNPALKLPALLWTSKQRFAWHRRLLIRIQDLFPSS
jgi:hypothetical protein